MEKLTLLIIIGIGINVLIIFSIRMSSKFAEQFYRAGRAIIDTGIEPKGIRAFGQPFEDTPRPRPHGEFFILISRLWRLSPRILIVVCVFIDLALIMWISKGFG